MNKIFIAFLLSFSLFFTACFDSSPKCDDETVKSLVFDILEENEWFYLESGLSEDSLRSLMIAWNGMDLRTFSNMLETANPYLKAQLEPLYTLREYANEGIRRTLSGFVSEKETESKERFCTAALNIEYPQMPEDLRKDYARGSLKGVIFDGGVAQKSIRYSTKFSDDKKMVYANVLSY